MDANEVDSSVHESYDEFSDEIPRPQMAHIGVDSLGYVSYMGSTPTPESELAIIPDDFDSRYLSAYRIEEGVLMLDTQRKAA